ncbi:MAG TPA: HAMP domain-containing sensor histidine kinase [Alphaproteobacteria bacterium]|jgi:signal transduction histidine kinase|nr:HAMP domain-containing sensor histidine kinase [Alphaproteobacteria bacterium]
MAEPSLQRRIIVRLALATLAAIVVGYGWLYLKAGATEAALRNRTLLDQAHDIASHLVLQRDGAVTLRLPEPLAEAYDDPKSAYHFSVRDDHGRVIVSSIGSVNPPLPSPDRPTYDYDPDGPGPLHVFGAAVQTVIGGRTYTTQVELTGSHDEYLAAAATEEFLADGGWLGVPFLVVLLTISILTVRGTLAPLERLSRLAADIAPGKAAIRLPEIDVPREVMPLVRAVNSALDRLDEGFQRQREFTANAAHQLRTPLAVLAANIDTMEDKAAARQLRADVDAMTRIVSQLLVVARLEATAIPLDDLVDLRAVATQAAASLGPLAIRAGKNIEVEPGDGPALTRGSAWVILNALGNLIENAVNHTPAGTAVTVRVTDQPGIEVRDSGPGVPPALRDKVFERFWRSEHGAGGAGLGLAIVKRIMDVLGGSVSIADAPGGGAVFALRFRPAGPATGTPA